MITLIAYAKLNLFLDITGIRQDGYHLLETVMQTVNLSDIVTVELTESGDIDVCCSDPNIPEDQENICHMAAKLFFDYVGKNSGADITIEKHIPMQSGLGGGSADAAAVLRGLNILMKNPVTDDALLNLAAKIGADVPFCLVGGTKLCGGIGELMTDATPYGIPYYLIVKPNFGCDTRAAYYMYDESPIPRKIRKDGEIYNVFRELYNYDEINSIIEKLKEFGAENAELTGSGSAIFGTFYGRRKAIAASRYFQRYFTAICTPVSHGVLAVG